MENADVKAIRDLAQQYSSSVENRQFDTLKSLFQTDIKLVGSYFGEYMSLSVDDWINFMKASEPKEDAEKPSSEILTAEVEGDIGLLKIRKLDNGVEITDYLGLQKIGGTWLIVSKTYRFAM